MLADCTAIARRSRVAVAIRFASAPIIRCCAAVGGSAALRMRHTPCGCRSAHLVEVLTNFRLPIVPTNAASAAMPLFRKQSAAVLPSLAPHDSKARLIVVTTRRDSWRSHVHRTYTAQRVQPFKLQTVNVGGRGPSPRLSLGDSKGVFSSEREYPLWCRGAHAAPPPALARENQGTPLEKGVKKTRHICGRSFSELISNNACCGSYGRPRSSCGA